MKNTFILWKNIIANPFEGYKSVNDSTKLLLPLLIIISLFLISTTMSVPILSSDSYSEVLVRSQITAMAEKGNEMSAEQQVALDEQIKSPMVRNITLASTYIVGLIAFIGIGLLLPALFGKIYASYAKKEKVKFSLIFKILIFAVIIGMVQSLIKIGITLTGDWQRALNRVNDASMIQYILQAPVSLAALLDPSEINKTLYMLIDAFTDVFNWIYYIFIYAGIKVSLQLEKKPALITTVIIAATSIIIATAMSFIG